ncbi:MAG: hypothetical protein WBM50_14115 [Acidimicrobiales bacterium]
MMLPVVLIVAYIMVIGMFLAALLMTVLESQRSQRRRMGQLAAELEELRGRLMTAKEREAAEINRREIEERNRRLRELYEHGGC